VNLESLDREEEIQKFNQGGVVEEIPEEKLGQTEFKSSILEEGGRRVRGIMTDLI
jgi:hypothetical protein